VLQHGNGATEAADSRRTNGNLASDWRYLEKVKKKGLNEDGDGQRDYDREHHPIRVQSLGYLIPVFHGADSPGKIEPNDALAINYCQSRPFKLSSCMQTRGLSSEEITI
jgi:hypothetical protein